MPRQGEADNTYNDKNMGKHSSGTVNDNGERLINFCGLNDLVMGVKGAVKE